MSKSSDVISAAIENLVANDITSLDDLSGIDKSDLRACGLSVKMTYNCHTFPVKYCHFPDQYLTDTKYVVQDGSKSNSGFNYCETALGVIRFIFIFMSSFFQNIESQYGRGLLGPVKIVSQCNTEKAF